jgi:hypothetical protein
MICAALCSGAWADVGVDEILGDFVSLNVLVQDEYVREFTLRGLIDRSIVMTMTDSDYPSICNVLLNGALLSPERRTWRWAKTSD